MLAGQEEADGQKPAHNNEAAVHERRKVCAESREGKVGLRLMKDKMLSTGLGLTYRGCI